MLTFIKKIIQYQLETYIFPEVDTSILKAEVHGVILGIPMPFDLPNPNGCKDSGITCPVGHGHSYKYLATLPILSSYPRVSGKKCFMIKDL